VGRTEHSEGPGLFLISYLDSVARRIQAAIWLKSSWTTFFLASRMRPAKRDARISSAVSLLKMTFAMCGYSVPIILTQAIQEKLYVLG
jgi:hypothetical protein